MIKAIALPLVFNVNDLSGHPLLSRAPDDSNRFERGSAMALRSFVLLLSAYVIVHRIFPFGVLGRHLADLTVGEFLLTMTRAVVASALTGYLVFKSLRQPALEARDRVWCERWSGLSFAVMAVVAGSIAVALLEKKGIAVAAALPVAEGVLWLIF
jgi:hypothetical protein